MRIIITSGTGEGPGRKAAFDAAVMDAGIGDYNIIPLSSVIPPNSEIVIAKPEKKASERGKKLYVVLSESYAEKKGRRAVAGLMWSVAAGGKGGGIFIEHSGDERGDVEKVLKESLDAMVEKRKGKFGAAESVYSSIACKRGTACSIVAAVYASEGWEENKYRRITY
jgi:arginine decarboxylase